MTEDEILGRLGRLARDLMGDDALNPTMETTGKDIPGWDSATFINFVVAVEMEFGVRLGLATIEAIDSFGDMVRAVKAAKP